VLTYNRLAIIGFALAVLFMAYLLLQRTSLGLTVRAVTQNRPMAAAMGINTARVDAWTFGLGSGIAGLGGVALSQLDNVAPDLGQGYIVDSFMVVVLGGVGQLAGTFVGAFGLGLLNKFLEPGIGAVLSKVLVLGLIILFIQRRPQGLFALRGAPRRHELMTAFSHSVAGSLPGDSDAMRPMIFGPRVGRYSARWWCCWRAGFPCSI